jgi:hypothetical protein
MSWTNIDLVNLITKKMALIMAELEIIKEEIKEIKDKNEGR